jgi:hypothetical protein
MSYYSQVLLDVYSVAETEEERAFLDNALELTLRNLLNKFYAALKVKNYQGGVDCFLEDKSLLLYASTVRYSLIEDDIGNLIDKLEELTMMGIKVAYELIVIGEDFTDVVEEYSDNANYRWYVARSIERN